MYSLSFALSILSIPSTRHFLYDNAKAELHSHRKFLGGLAADDRPKLSLDKDEDVEIMKAEIVSVNSLLKMMLEGLDGFAFRG